MDKRTSFKYRFGELVTNEFYYGVYKIVNRFYDSDNIKRYLLVEHLPYSEEKSIECVEDALSPYVVKEEGVTKNSDGTVNVEVDLSLEEIGRMALEAHKMDITLNEYMVRVLTEQASKDIEQC